MTCSEFYDATRSRSLRRRTISDVPAFEAPFATHPPDVRGGFEAHITVDTDRTAEFQTLCAELGVDYVAIELAAGVHRAQPMTASRHKGELAHVIAEVEAIHTRIAAAGFTIVRTKLEAAASNQGIPTGDGYFEFHVKVADEREAELAAIADAHGARLSKNGRSGSRFITMRTYGDFLTAEAKLDRMLLALDTAALARRSIAREYTIYDSRIALDAGWLEPP